MIPRDKNSGKFIEFSTRKLGESRILFLDQEQKLDQLNLARNKSIRAALDYCLTYVPEIFGETCRKAKKKSRKSRSKTTRFSRSRH